ncbi:hypothetical protein C8J56DRAFT_1129602 [Mycena floridula]|nr:hypothetical protein C8J56DRAFT_1129602 [Mycena floridula]
MPTTKKTSKAERDAQASGYAEVFWATSIALEPYPSDREESALFAAIDQQIFQAEFQILIGQPYDVLIKKKLGKLKCRGKCMIFYGRQGIFTRQFGDAILSRFALLVFQPAQRRDYFDGPTIHPVPSWGLVLILESEWPCKAGENHLRNPHLSGCFRRLRSPLTSFFNLLQIFSNFFLQSPMLFFRVTLAASLLLFSVSAIPVPPEQSYDPVRDAPSNNVDSHPIAYGTHPPSVPQLAPQLQPSTPKSPARASDSSSGELDVSNNRSSKAALKRQGSPSSQSPAKAIKGPQLSDKPFPKTKRYERDECKYKTDRNDRLTVRKRTHDPNTPSIYISLQ